MRAGSRRGVLLGLMTGLGAACLGCDRGPEPSATSSGRLSFRPSAASGRVRRTGVFTLQGSPGFEPAQVYVPEVAAGTPLRLVVMLHGANGHPRRALSLLRTHAKTHGLVLLAPQSREATWDVLRGGFGPDVDNIDRLLRRVTRSCPVAAYAVGGFSDGASYALTLGLVNGDLFDAVIAFSPGFEAAEVRHGKPRFFISHGTTDEVLPIDRSSRRIVPALREDGYDVTYEEFAGDHAIPVAIRARAAAWLAGPGSASTEPS